MSTDDRLIFAEENPSEDELNNRNEQGNSAHWKLLIVDDEEDVHSSTVLALQREIICRRPLQFLHAYTGEEAVQILSENNDIAAVLLDVVMESEHAGLALVQRIRQELNRSALRIILRTGQPGYAPELETIKQYDINDYRAKSELTRNKLYTCITTAIRSYSQIKALELSKQGLERIILASKELLYLRGFKEFAQGIITQLTGVFHLPDDGMVCVRRHAENHDDIKVIAATGKHIQHVSKAVDELDTPQIVESIIETLDNKHNLYRPFYTCLYFITPDNAEVIVYLATGIDPLDDMMQLLELFSTNICAGIDNVMLLEQKHNFAYEDQLLHIPNRLSFLQEIDEALYPIAEKREVLNLQVVLIDIDQFGALNDTIGSDHGDTLLKLVSARLKEHFPAQLIARISGDTFGLLGEPEILTPQAVSDVFLLPFQVEGAYHSISATQGRVQLNDQETGTDVISQANVALKRAKQTLRGSALDFHTDMLKETESRVHLLQNLRHAFNQERLFMVYQPKIDLRTGKINGVEALMRWKNDEGNYVAPLDFIPIAESSGLIVHLGEWALKTALVKISHIRKKLKVDLSVAVNVSMVQFAHPDFLNMLDQALEFAEAKPEWLELEITESVAMHDTYMVKALIDDINQRGVKISIDDFGTGFSSLSYLEQLKVHYLKIDKSFIDRIDEHDIDTRIPETILRLAQVLGLDVIAEGVETEFQKNWLEQNGCQYVQGYYFAKPIPRDQLEDWIIKHLQED